jgi:hypothetical protein
MSHTFKIILVWVLIGSLQLAFAGCVEGCEERAETPRAAATALSFSEIQSGEIADECSLNSFPKALSSQRVVIQKNQVHLKSDLFASAIIPARLLLIPHVWGACLDPPLTRATPALRI